MEYSKDIIFNVGYNDVNNVLKDNRGKRWTSIVQEKLNKHKIIAIIGLICVILIVVDACLIFNFARILQSAIIM